MPIALYALAVSSFAIGTTEFVIMGLLPQIATDLQVSIPIAGWLVSGYALGVAIGAPIMAFLTAQLPRKTALLILMGIFIVGNVLCAVAAGYGLLMFARVVTALCHGAFFGIGAVVAASLVPEHRKASAVALMFTGLTLANVLGVPFGTALGQAAGWRATFWAVAGIGVLAFIALARLLPVREEAAPPTLHTELNVLRRPAIWAALGMTVFFSAAMFALFTYIAPILGDVTHVSPRGVTWTLLLIGLGLTVGGIGGGRLMDWQPMPTLIGSLIVMMLLQALFSWSSHAVLPTEITLFLWGASTFAAAIALQMNVITTGKDAPNLVSILNIGAFNIGNALGAWVGGRVIDVGLGWVSVTWAAVALSLSALMLAVLFIAFTRTRIKIS